MNGLTVSQHHDAFETVTADAVVVIARVSDSGPVLIADPAIGDVSSVLTELGFSGKADEVVRLPSRSGAGTIVVAGLGDEVSATSVRGAVGTAIRQLAGRARVALALGQVDLELLMAAVEGAHLAAYAFTPYRAKSADAVKAPVAEVVVVSTATIDDEALTRIRTVAENIHLVRDLTNRSGGDLYPQALADAVVEAAAGTSLQVEVWDEVRLAAEGCGGILGVGQGSSRPPRLIKISYAPDGVDHHIALVGKGITYDTGGYSLKPAEAMVSMQNDMGGAAVVFGLVRAAAQLALPVRLTAWLCVSENLVSSTAIRPNDILTIRGGTTVEVMNTDAEGRLVMADGLVLASEEHPDAIIDVATLTGAAIVALGRRTVGVMGDRELVGGIVEAGEATGEPHWAMPLPAELRSQLDSRFADMTNLKVGNRDGGMLVAAIFLREFVGTTADGASTIPWAHLDIAGAAVNEGPAYGYLAEGATGVSVRTLLHAIEQRVGD
ncbi:MAG: leucyl aminopeptidase [Microcella sp.]